MSRPAKVLGLHMFTVMQYTASPDFGIVFSHPRNILLTDYSVNVTLATFQLQRIKRPSDNDAGKNAHR